MVLFSGRGRTTRHQDRSGLGHGFRAQRSTGAEQQTPGWEGCEPERALSHGGSLPTGKAKPLGLLPGTWDSRAALGWELAGSRDRLRGAQGTVPSDLLHAESLPGAIWAPPDSKP